VRFRISLFVLAILLARPLGAQQDSLVAEQGDSVTIRLVDVDLRAAVQALSRYMDRPVVFSGAAGNRVTLETPRPVPRRDIPRLLRGMLDSQQMELVDDSASGIYRLRARDATHAAAPGVSPTPTVAQQGLELFVIHLRHAKASEVAATVNALYGRASALGELGQRNDPPLSRGLTQNQIPPAGVAPSPQAVPGAAGQNAALTSETTIVPDSRANSLLIRATRADFALIQAAVNELDIRPLQVLIEVLIAEVRRDRSLDFGVDVETGKRTTSRSGGTTIETTNTSNSLGDFVLKIMDLGRTNIDATIRAAASRGDVHIISRPVLLAANNERAVINVGSQRPFVQVARVLPTDNTARDQVVQYKDVGTKLQIIPTISADGYVMLQVAQEIDAATAEQQFDAPVISTRSVETRLLVKDGRTIVIGGLIDRQREVVQSGVPILSSIPWLGGLFGRAHRSRTETELFLFLTPRVIRRDEDVDDMTQEYQRRARVPKP
jgi:general secretion pathway protein D